MSIHSQSASNHNTHERRKEDEIETETKIIENKLKRRNKIKLTESLDSQIYKKIKVNFCFVLLCFFFFSAQQLLNYLLQQHFPTHYLVEYQFDFLHYIL